MWDHGLGIQVEHNDANNSEELLRFGLVYIPPVKNAFLMLRAFPLETDGEGGQVSLAWKTKVYYEKLFFEGFADYNIKEGQDNAFVLEPQLRYMLTDQLGLVAEYRLNEFLKNKAPLKEEGWAFGLTYIF